MTQPLLFRNARIITPTHVLENGWLLCRGGKIAAIAPYNAPNINDAHVINADGLTLLPGFIDVHAHGGNGFDVMDGNIESLAGIAKFYAQSGVTSFLATTWTDTPENTFNALKAISTIQNEQTLGATILGAHLEGPFLNAEKCGAQNSDLIRYADHHEAMPYLDMDVIQLLAIAPEFKQNQWLITEAIKRGITVSIAHSSARYEEVKFATTLGLSHATHTFNAMTPLHHREPGTVGAVLSDDRITCEVIADLIHVHPAVIDIIWRTKGKDRIVLITDCVKLAGLADGSYHFSHQDVEMKNGTVRIQNSGTLAGTTLGMNRALHNLMSVTKEPLHNVWQTSSANPARVANVSHKKGSLVIGKDADLVLVNDDIQVFMTIVEGRIVYNKIQNLA